ncbi:MAG: protoheme IX farnesyltransferase [Candidatus Promineifilaceae bacterium]|jgi:protoheme IX farnesyltransferase
MSVTPIPSSQATGFFQASPREVMKSIAVLFKLRVVSLLVLSAIGGAFLGARGFPGWANFGLITITGLLTAAGASAINQYWEREKDRLMKRTANRPLASGAIEHPKIVLIIATLLILVPSLAVFPFRPWLTVYLLVGAFIYVVIYTIWLKPRTQLNIVIGGAAGSAAVLSGGAVVGMHHDPAVLALAAVMFVWTPAHFWSLAIMMKEDYIAADTPMLPSRVHTRTAAWMVMAHAIPTVLGSLMLAAVPGLGLWYFLPVLIFSIDLIRRNIKLIWDPTVPNAKSLFLASNFYLMIVLLSIMIVTPFT